MKISGSIIVITGAGSGIGAATAKKMSAKGGHILLLDKDAEGARIVAEEIVKKGGKAKFYQLDLTDYKEVERVANDILSEFKKVDIVVNNAGAGKFIFLDETSFEEVEKIMASPYFIAAYITKVFLPGMLERNFGHIVNITSAAGRIPWPSATCYTAARWAMRGFDKGLRADLINTNIKITLCEFSKVSSGYWKHNVGSEERVPGITKLIPTITPEEAAEALISGVENDKSWVVKHFILKIFYALHYIFPFFIERLVWKTGYFTDKYKK